MHASPCGPAHISTDSRHSVKPFGERKGGMLESASLHPERYRGNGAGLHFWRS